MRKVIYLLVLASGVALTGVMMTTVSADAKRDMNPETRPAHESIGELDRVIATGDPSDIKERHDAVMREVDALTARPAWTRETARQNIIRFRGGNMERLDYLKTAKNPYGNGNGKIETYADDKGFEYWIDPENDRLVQAGPRPSQYPSPRTTRKEDRLPVGRLREIAIRMLTDVYPEFTETRTRLHPLEDNKNRQVYFFRWDDFSSPLAESETAPFIQIGLFPDGSLASFTNTIAQ